MEMLGGLSALEVHLGANVPHADDVACQTQIVVLRECGEELISRLEDLARWLQAQRTGRCRILARGKQGRSQAMQPISSRRWMTVPNAARTPEAERRYWTLVRLTAELTV